MTIAAAFAIFALAIAIFAVPTLRLGSEAAVAQVSGSASDYPPTPASGYWVLFPTQISRGDGSNAQVFAETNLPEGTIYQTGNKVFGSAADQTLTSMFGCCDRVRNGLIGMGAGNDSCNASPGGGARSAGFSVTVTVTPSIDASSWSHPSGYEPEPIDQPPQVLATLGDHFERLVGDQVRELPDGSGNELVAVATYDWPEPQCGA